WRRLPLDHRDACIVAKCPLVAVSSLRFSVGWSLRRPGADRPHSRDPMMDREAAGAVFPPPGDEGARVSPVMRAQRDEEARQAGKPRAVGQPLAVGEPRVTSVARGARPRT